LLAARLRYGFWWAGRDVPSHFWAEVNNCIAE
jgi:hypothetical protein